MPRRLTHYPPLYAATLLLFFTGGFVSVLNELLAPEFKRYFHLNYAQAMLTQFSFFLAYAVLSVPAARLLNRWGWRRGLLCGLAAILLSAMLFVPADAYKNYDFFLLGLFGMAAGVVMLEVAGNPLVTWLGAAETVSARLNLAQSFNPLAATIVPLAVSDLIFHGQFTLLSLIIAAVLLPVMLIFWRLPLNVALPNAGETKLTGKLHPVVAFGVLALFLYVGAEVAAGSLLVNYLHEVNGLAYRHATPFLSLYWGGLLAGRLIGAYAMTRLSPARCLFVVAVICIVLLAAVVWAPPHVALYSLPALGWFNAVMFPTIIAITLGSVSDSRARNRATGFLLMGIAGGAVVPELQGVLADHVGLRHSFLLLPLCYLAIAAFAGYMARPSRACFKGEGRQRHTSF